MARRDFKIGSASVSAIVLFVVAGCRAPAPGPSSSANGTGASVLSLGDKLRALDVVSLDVFPQDHGPYGAHALARVRAVDSAGVLGESRADAPGLSVAGVPVRIVFLHGGRGTEQASQGSTGEAVELVIAATEDGAVAPGDVLALFGEADRASVVITTRAGGASSSSDTLELGVGPMGYHRRTLAQLERASSAVPAGAPFLGAKGPASTVDAGDREAFLAFCEHELLVRRLDTQQNAGPSPASGWFGGHVSLSPHPEDAAVRALPAVMEELFLEGGATAESERGATSEPRGERASVWAIPRWLELRERVGKREFRALLRDVVDRHRGGDALGLAEVADAAERVAPGLGARFVRSWMASPAAPKLRTQWRYDAARGRILLRVDQVHGLVDGRTAPAFPLRLPVRAIGPNGATLDRILDISKRRDLLEIEVDFQPEDVLIDPTDALADLVDFAQDEPR